MGRLAGALHGMTALPRAWRGAGVAALLVPRVRAADAPGRSALLAELLGCDADDVAFAVVAGPFGRPSLRAPSGASFGIAHRGGTSLLGARSGDDGIDDVGVDLELVRDDLDCCGIAETYFADAETRWLRALDAPRRALAFTALWTVKEAVLKASGRGIAGGMRTPRVDTPALMPLVAGIAATVELHGRELGTVHVRTGTLDDAPAVACLAQAANARWGT